MPPLPLSPLKSPPLPGLSSLYIDSELQQLNGDIRRKYDEPRPLGSSLLDRLATVFRIATVSPTFPSPCLSVLQAALLGSVTPTRLTTDRSFIKNLLSLCEFREYLMYNINSNIFN